MVAPNADELTRKRCVPCEGGVPNLTPEEAAGYLDGLSGWVEIGTAGVNYPTFTDDTAQPNSTYFYRVRSYNSFAGGSYSDYTNVAQATTSPNPTGSGDGLLGGYYNNQDFTGSTVTRIDPRVNFDWGTGTPAPGSAACSSSSRCFRCSPATWCAPSPGSSCWAMVAWSIAA